MRKVIKIILSILSVIILLVIMIPILASLLLHVPSIQNSVVRQLTERWSEKAGTTIKVDRIGLKLFNRVTVDGFYVEDYHQDTLFYADRVVAPIAYMRPLQGQFTLGAVKVENPTFYLMQDSTGITNLRQILAHFKKDRKEKQFFSIRANSVEVNNLRFKHRKLERKLRTYGVEFTDVEVWDLFLKAHDISVVNDSVNLVVDAISLKEKSGLVIDHVSSERFSISGKGMYFEGLKVITPDSDVTMSHLNFGYSHWDDVKEFIDDVNIEGEVIDSRVSFKTIAFFAQGLQHWTTTLDNVSATANGPISAMTGNIEFARTANTEISTQFGIYGIPEMGKARFTFDMPHLVTDKEDIQCIVEEITRKELDPKLLGYVEKMGQVGFSGRFDGMFSEFTADGLLLTDQGEVDLKLEIRPLPESKTGFAGHISTTDFQLEELFSAQSLDYISTSADISGELGDNDFQLNAIAEIPALRFNDYTYNSVSLKGAFDNRKFTGAVTSTDKNLSFDFDGELDFNTSLTAYNFDLKLYNADLYALNFNKRDTVSQIRCEITAQGEGTKLDSINGQLTIRDMTYINHIDTVETGLIRFVANNNDQRKEISMYSSFADIEFRGQHSYSNMISYFRNTLMSYLPSIQSNDVLELNNPIGTAPTDTIRIERSNGNGNGSSASVQGYYALRMNVKEANNVAGIFFPGLQLAEGTNLSFLFNPESDVFSLTANSEYIERENFYIENLNINGQNQGDSISLFVQAGELYVGGLFMPNFSVLGGAKENRINLATRFQNTENSTYAMISTTSQLIRDPETNASKLAVNFYPSTVAVGNQVWGIGGRNILLDTSQISIERFSIVNGEQRLTVNGVASHNRTDTLKVRLQDFNLAPLSRISQPKGYRIDGVANGYLDMISALSSGLMNAHVTFDSVHINDIPFRGTTFNSSWDFGQARAQMQLYDTEGGDTIAYGFYRPHDKQYLAYVTLKNIEMSLLDPLLEGVVTNTQGTANARVTLTNPRGKLLMNGEVDVPTLSTMVDFTRVPYSIRNATGTVKDNIMTIHPTRVYDPQGNNGSFELSLDFTNFRNLAYDVRIRPERMQVLRTTFQDNELFYGNVFASGFANIRGNKAGTTMDIVATTDNNSYFYMPLSSTSIDEADFIVFESPAERAAADSIAALTPRRRLMMRQRNRQQTRRGNMDINMALNVLPNAELQLTIDAEEENILQGRGNGRLNLRINPNNNVFTMYGDYNITEGTYQFSLRNIINRTFIIDQGSTIQWTGDPVDAMLNISAQYNLKASLAPLISSEQNRNFRSSVPVDCIIRLTDHLAQPTITFDVQVPNTDPEIQAIVMNAMNTQEMMATQFIWLLAVNSFYSDNSGNNPSMNIGAMGGTVTGVEFLSSQLSNWLSTDRFSLVPKYRPRSELTSDEVGLAFSAELIKDRLTIEVDGSYDTGNNVTQTANSLTSDVYINLNLDQSGNLRAKGFTRTIDRFDENQGLQETGVGVSYRESFDTFRDLRQTFKERFARIGKKRRERRAAKAATQAEALLEEQNAGETVEGEAVPE